MRADDISPGVPRVRSADPHSNHAGWEAQSPPPGPDLIGADTPRPAGATLTPWCVRAEPSELRSGRSSVRVPEALALAHPGASVPVTVV
ncbi:hypothetical protein GHT09_014371 [Marmota monax]|uniref:Uncharacterized protein n=1 Tax=Marmota monax TaxID=9995 RepID=A0A834UYA0_MARMO|nr:hypothetical protein GHT09_014371 [Marmota monax]